VRLEPSPPRGLPASFAAFPGCLPPERDYPGFSIPRGVLLDPTFGHGTEPTIVAGEPELAAGVHEPLEPRSAHASRKSSGWKATLTFSCLLHAAAALAFLSADPGVLVEGSQDTGLLMLGNAAQDQSAAGEPFPDAMQVTLVTMLAPRPVETVEAVAVDAIPAETVAALPVQPEPAKPVEAEKVPVEQAAAESPVLDTVEAEEAPAVVPPAAPVPSILTANAVSPSAEAVLPVQSVEPVESEPALAEAVALPESPEKPKAVVKAAVQPAKKAEKQPPTHKKAQVEPDDKAKAKAPKAEKVAKQAGSGGKGGADARRGLATGDARGTKTEAGNGGKLTAAGNAAISNYPGKVAAKLKRAARGLGASTRGRARGDVRVSFTVIASGDVVGVKVAASSGSPELDKAALAVVRRAAPFPPIPPEAGRKSWTFTLPLGVR
jgi:protein TonB